MMQNPLYCLCKFCADKIWRLTKNAVPLQFETKFKLSTIYSRENGRRKVQTKIVHASTNKLSTFHIRRIR